MRARGVFIRSSLCLAFAVGAGLVAQEAPKGIEAISLSGEIEASVDVRAPDGATIASDFEWAPLAGAELRTSIRPAEGLGCVVRGYLYARGGDWALDAHGLEEAYLSIDAGEAVNIILGKKRLEWGRAILFSPGNFFQDPPDPLARGRLEGTSMARLALITTIFSAEALLRIGRAADDTGLGLRLGAQALVPHTDISVLGYWSRQREACAGITVEATPLAEAGILTDLALYAEAGFSRKSVLPRPVTIASVPGLEERPLKSNPLIDGVYAGISGGLRCSLPFASTIVAAEYAFRWDGCTKEETELLASSGLLWSYPAGLASLGRQCLIVSLWQPGLTVDTWRWSDSLSAGLTLLSDPEGGSGALRGVVESAYNPDLVAGFEWTRFFGPDASLWTAARTAWSLKLYARMAF